MQTKGIWNRIFNALYNWADTDSWEQDLLLGVLNDLWWVLMPLLTETASELTYWVLLPLFPLTVVNSNMPHDTLHSSSSISGTNQRLCRALQARPTSKLGGHSSQHRPKKTLSYPRKWFCHELLLVNTRRRAPLKTSRAFGMLPCWSYQQLEGSSRVWYGLLELHSFVTKYVFVSHVVFSDLKNTPLNSSFDNSKWIRTHSYLYLHRS